MAFCSKLVMSYHSLSEEIINAVSHYISDVKAVDFPNEKEQY